MTVIAQTLLFALLIEAVTIFARMFFGPIKIRFQKLKFKYKVRIHHGYIGLILLLFYQYIPNDALLIIGGGLLISDVLHHFLVLPLWVGKTEFP